MISKVIIILLFLSFSLPAESTILCVGDSITEGSSHFSVYRYPLYQKLKNSGFKFSFVGSKQSKQDGIILKHNGYGGQNTHFLSSKIVEIYKANPADFVLLHSGHNSFAKNKPVAGIIASTKKIVESIHKINPRAIIIIAKVIPAGKLPKYSYIPALNEELDKLVDSQIVFTADMADGFDWKEDTIGDKVHPNKKGAEKMAQKWFEVLSSFKERFK